jgi:hypothetical protein
MKGAWIILNDFWMKLKLAELLFLAANFKKRVVQTFLDLSAASM